MKTEIYVLAVNNPISGQLTVTGRGTRREVLDLLITRVVPALWPDNALERAKEALAKEQFDVVEAIVGNSMLFNWHIEKVPLEVEDPLVKKLRAENRRMRRELAIFNNTKAYRKELKRNRK